MKRALKTCAYRLFPRFDRVEAAWGILHDEPTVYNVTIRAGRDVTMTGIHFWHRGIPDGVTLLESGGTVRGTTLTGWKNGKRNGEIALKFPPRAPVYRNIDITAGRGTVPCGRPDCDVCVTS
jgi:hypothetical protein